LNFHYDRGEDEEWHEAHYELVRIFPESIRINYSYKKGLTTFLSFKSFLNT